MKALVIGAAGLVGGALMRTLRDRDTAAIGTYHARAVPGLQRLDVTHAEAIRRMLLDVRPTVVFLPAALTAVDYCEDHRDEAWAINVEGPRQVASAASEAGAKLVFYSTEYVFDGADGPYGEDDPISPRGAYARSKAEGEQAIRDTLADHIVIRTTIVFGWDPASKNFAMQVLQRLSAGEPMRVPSDQIGNPTLVDFLAESSVQLVERGFSGTVNVVGRDRVPRTEFAVRLAAGLGLDASLIDPVTTAELHQVAPRPLAAGLKTDRLVAVLGTEPIALDDAIAHFAHQCLTTSQNLGGLH